MSSETLSSHPASTEVSELSQTPETPETPETPMITLTNLEETVSYPVPLQFPWTRGQNFKEGIEKKIKLDCSTSLLPYLARRSGSTHPDSPERFMQALEYSGPQPPDSQVWLHLLSESEAIELDQMLDYLGWEEAQQELYDWICLPAFRTIDYKITEPVWWRYWASWMLEEKEDWYQELVTLPLSQQLMVIRGILTRSWMYQESIPSFTTWFKLVTSLLRSPKDWSPKDWILDSKDQFQLAKPDPSDPHLKLEVRTSFGKQLQKHPPWSAFSQAFRGQNMKAWIKGLIQAYYWSCYYRCSITRTDFEQLLTQNPTRGVGFSFRGEGSYEGIFFRSLHLSTLFPLDYLQSLAQYLCGWIYTSRRKGDTPTGYQCTRMDESCPLFDLDWNPIHELIQNVRFRQAENEIRQAWRSNVTFPSCIKIHPKLLIADHRSSEYSWHQIAGPECRFLWFSWSRLIYYWPQLRIVVDITLFSNTHE